MIYSWYSEALFDCHETYVGALVLLHRRHRTRMLLVCLFED